MVFSFFGDSQLENATPQVFDTVKERPVTAAELDDNVEDPIDAR